MSFEKTTEEHVEELSSTMPEAVHLYVKESLAWCFENANEYSSVFAARDACMEYVYSSCIQYGDSPEVAYKAKMLLFHMSEKALKLLA